MRLPTEATRILGHQLSSSKPPGPKCAHSVHPPFRGWFGRHALSSYWSQVRTWGATEKAKSPPSQSGHFPGGQTICKLVSARAVVDAEKQRPAHGASVWLGLGPAEVRKVVRGGAFTLRLRTHWGVTLQAEGDGRPLTGREEGGLWVLPGPCGVGREGRAEPVAGGEVGAARSVPAGPRGAAPFILRAPTGTAMSRGDTDADRMNDERLASPRLPSHTLLVPRPSPHPTASPDRFLTSTRFSSRPDPHKHRQHPSCSTNHMPQRKPQLVTGQRPR